MRAPALAALLSSLVLVGCSPDSGNPFASGSATQAPSADAAILFLSSSYATDPGSPREIMAIDAAGSAVERLTGCALAVPPCDFVQVAPSPDRNRVAAIRTQVGSAAGSTALYYIDLARSVEKLLQPSRHISFVDWSPDNSFIIYSAYDAGGNEDVFFSAPDGTAEQQLTQTSDARERVPRVDPLSRTAAYELIDSTGVGRIWVFQLIQVTAGGATGPALPGTPYVVGGDADPAWSPEATQIVFRRLTGTGNGGLGTWDLMKVNLDGTNLQTVATGAVFRGAPDWGRAGILFVESDAAAGESRLVIVQPDGSGRKVLRTEPLVFNMTAPRFLPGQ
jgi:Tol biopolymer transport system component